MNLFPNIFDDLVGFAAQEQIRYTTLIRIIDYVFNSLEVNVESEEELDDFLTTTVAINTSILMYHKPNETEDQKNLYTPNIDKFKTNGAIIPKYQAVKLKIYETFYPDIVTLGNKYKLNLENTEEAPIELA